ncbi:MAG: winged helix-turn-helix domain-containing protein [Pseudonocardia sp.]|nr:winged helix-turn-helix domain-containing protein [Pseudonocardia sp.]
MAPVLAAATFEFRVLGSLEVLVDGHRIDISSRKQRMLLCALAVTPGRPVSTDALVALLWGDEPPASVEVTLRSLASRLRRALGPVGGVLQGGDGGYLLRVDPERIDAFRFERQVASGRASLAAGRSHDAAVALRSALGMFRGPVLVEIADQQSMHPIAHRFEELGAAATEDLVEAELAAGAAGAAVELLNPHLARYALRERPWGQLMLALYRLGRQADALATYRRLRDTLREELGVEPNPDLRRLERQILRQDPDLDLLPAPGTRPPIAGSSHNLPAALTPLVGRATELAELAEELARTRLLTLTGVGGVGKTRLALRLASDVLDGFPDGVRLVELGPLDAATGDAERDAAVGAEVAAALGVPTPGRADADALAVRLRDHLEDRRTLLVLDNCEHVVSATARLVAWVLRACPQVRVLATSREPLGVPGEVVWAVPPLALPPVGPDGSSAPDHAALAGFDAIALFCQRARAAQVGFGLTAENAVAVEHICRHLDGIPLAIELAAARMRALGAQQVAARLRDRFALLTAGDRTALPRQQTLLATMDWSYQLLTADEQAALRSLTVFPATFDLDAAEAVVGGGVDLVLRLVDKSMVVARRRRGEVRYGLLETVRAYGTQRCAGASDTAAARRRHREHFVELAAAERRSTSPNWDSAQWHRRAASDEDNFRVAIAWALADGDIDAALLMLSGLLPYWMWAGRAEALVWLEEALAMGPGRDDVARCEATTGLAVLHTWWELGEPAHSAELFLRGRELAERADDDRCRFRVRYFHAEFLLLRGDRAAAMEVFADARRVTDAAGDVGWCHHSLGWIAMGDGDRVTARAEFERAVELSQGSDLLVPHALAALAPLTAADGDHRRAADLAAAAVVAAERFELPGVLVMVLVRAAQTRLLCGEIPAVQATLADLFDLLHTLGTRQFRAEACELAAVLAQRSGAPGRAARYFGAVDAIRAARAEDRGAVNVLGPLSATCRERARAELGERGFATAATAGAAVAARDLVAEVRAELLAARTSPAR